MMDLIARAAIDELAMALLELEPHQPAEEARDRAKNMSHMDPLAFASATSGHIWGELDPDELVRSVATPVAVLLGDEAAGSVWSPEMEARLLALNERFRFIRVRGARHRVHLSSPSEFASEYFSFIESLRA